MDSVDNEVIEFLLIYYNKEFKENLIVCVLKMHVIVKRCCLLLIRPDSQVTMCKMLD